MGIPIVNPRYEREFDKEKVASQRYGPLTRSDLLLASSDWSSLVVGRLGHSINVDSNSNNKINLCLCVTETCPDDVDVMRWVGEPVKTVRVPTSIFLLNKKGYPVLSKQHQNLIRKFIALDIQIIVYGAQRGHQMKFYQQYLDHLYQQVPVGDPLQQFARGYEDYLQCPLQPLMDNLESQTYEVFEKDPVKYSEYENAVCQALLDRVPESKTDEYQVVMVVGAGR